MFVYFSSRARIGVLGSARHGELFWPGLGKLISSLWSDGSEGDVVEVAVEVKVLEALLMKCDPCIWMGGAIRRVQCFAPRIR